MVTCLKEFGIYGIYNITTKAIETLNNEFSNCRNNLWDYCNREFPETVKILNDILETTGLEENTREEVILCKLLPEEYWEMMEVYKNTFDKLTEINGNVEDWEYSKK